MLFRTPNWWRRPGFVAELLVPFSVVYYLWLLAWRVCTRVCVAPVPVVCVGNATAGGAGKTPVALALGEALKERYRIAFVSRGYGGKLRGPVQVDLAVHNAAEVGDEPLLLARVAPCWVARDRYDGIKAAAEAGAELVILDDGLQSRRVEMAYALCVIDGEYGVGNGLLLPAGPLRDKLSTTCKVSDVVLLVGEDSTALLEKLPALPVHHAKLTVAPPEERLTRYIAFAGIGRPEKFFTTLEAAGYTLIDRVAFADHHPFSEEDMEILLAGAEEKEAKLITTQKDAVRIPEAYRAVVEVVPVQLEWEDKEAVMAEIMAAVEGK